ncbi:hypothetical protein ACFSSA_06030 [Luteolibacter algae]|uniref:Uncharacterized protein n=1 Tax=Luteolibacter algae TaxID=454151 RepID=A0ABW5D596_9BACT
MDKTYTPTEIEKALRNLMPVALSESISSETEEMLDQLGSDILVPIPRKRALSAWMVPAGIAALVAFLLTFFLSQSRQLERATVGDALSSENIGPLVSFLTESDRVENFSDDGLIVDDSGSAVHKVRVRVVEESKVRDEETGIIVQLTEPREEMYLVPVSTF